MALSWKSVNPPPIRLFKVAGAGMYPSTLLVCKLLALVFLLHHGLNKFNVPFLPLFRPFDALLPYAYPLSIGMRMVFLLAAAALLFNLRPRAACLVLGACILVLLLAARGQYRNHIIIVACVFILGACHGKDEPPWLIVVQVTALYLFAGLNKLFEPDWRTGQFMANWLAGHHAWYDLASRLLPGKLLAQALCWGTIVGEVAVGLLFISGRLRPLAVWLAAGFHLSLFVLLDGMTFGFFLHDAMIVLVACVPWGAPGSRLATPRRWERAARFVKRWCDFDDHFAIEGVDSGFRLTIEPDRRFKGFAAVRSAIVRLPVVYFVLLVTMIALPYVARPAVSYLAISATAVILWIAAYPYDRESSRTDRDGRPPAQEVGQPQA